MGLLKSGMDTGKAMAGGGKKKGGKKRGGKRGR